MSNERCLNCCKRNVGFGFAETGGQAKHSAAQESTRQIKKSIKVFTYRSIRIVTIWKMMVSLWVLAPASFNSILQCDARPSLSPKSSSMHIWRQIRLLLLSLMLFLWAPFLLQTECGVSQTSFLSHLPLAHAADTWAKVCPLSEIMTGYENKSESISGQMGGKYDRAV